MWSSAYGHARAPKRVLNGERAGEPRLSHVVLAAARLAGLSNSEPMKQVVRARGAGELLIHHSAEVAGVPVLEHDDGRGRLPAVPGDPDATHLAEGRSHDPELPHGSKATMAPPRERQRLVVLARPTLDRPFKSL